MSKIRQFKRKKKARTSAQISLIDLNKQIYDQLPELTEEQLNIIKKDIAEWFTKVGYAMLLSNENRDYTVFINKSMNGENAVGDFLECLHNRGTIHDIEYIKENDSWDIWLKIDGEMIYYKLFDYIWGIIKY